MRSFKPLFIYLIFLASPVCYAAEIYVSTASNADGGSIVIEGEIVKGDYVRFVDTIISAGVMKGEVYISSLGGDAFEAMKIGSLIRQLRFSTFVPSSKETCLTSSCDCASSCFLIFLSGADRSGSVLGVHRTYLNHDTLKELSYADAERASQEINTIVDAYMSKMGAQKTLIEEIAGIPSSDIKYLEYDYIWDNLNGYAQGVQEWVVANCGPTALLYEALVRLPMKERAGSTVEQEIYAAIVCEANLMLSARQEAFNPAITKALTVEKHSPYPEGETACSAGKSDNLLECFSNGPAETLKALRLYGFGGIEGHIRLAKEGLLYGEEWLVPENVSLFIGTGNRITKLTFYLTEDVPDRVNIPPDFITPGYKGLLFSGLNHQSSLKNFEQVLGDPVIKRSTESGALVIFRTEQADISVWLDSESGLPRTVTIEPPNTRHEPIAEPPSGWNFNLDGLMPEAK